MTVTLMGALIALILAIILILKKVPPVYGMLIGAFVGGFIGLITQYSLDQALVSTVNIMMQGAQGIMPAVLRIIAAGVLAGVLIESGAALIIAETIIHKVGESRALLALILATAILTMAGVFIDVAIITVAPIALAIGHKANLSKMAILLAMSGGGKAGNIMSPNPNSIAVADFFNLELTSVMAAGVIPALFGIIVTVFIAKKLVKKGSTIQAQDLTTIDNSRLPNFFCAILGPLVAIGLLMLRPLAKISVDPMIALPIGGLVGAIVMGRAKELNRYVISGLSRMSGIAIMLLGTGTLAGIVGSSELKTAMESTIHVINLPDYMLAPISGAFMGLATASTTAGAAVASASFGQILLGLGISALGSAAMIQAGATMLDHMPHGSYFHATGGATNMEMKERLKLIPYESLVGFTLAAFSTFIFGVFALF